MTGQERETLALMRNELAAFRHEMTTRMDSLETSVKPAMDFYQRVLGVLAVVKFLGPVGLFAALAGLFLFLLPK